LPAYVEIMVPWVPGPNGFGLPADPHAVVRTCELLDALLGLEAGSVFVEHPSRTPLAAVEALDFGMRPAKGLPATVSDALLEPRMLDGEPVSRLWIANGCTITTVHPFNEHVGGGLCVMVMMPIEANEAVAALVNGNNGNVAMKPDGRGFRASIDTLVLSVWPLRGRDAIDHCDLYAPVSLRNPHRWVSSIGRNTFGIGATIYASALPLRPSTGGFLEFFTGAVLAVRGWSAFIAAFTHQPWRALLGWLITRTSAVEAWVAIPREVAEGSHADMLAYLQSAASLDAGWIDVHQRVLCDTESNGLYGWIRADKYEVSVVSTIKAFAGALPVTIEVAEIRTGTHAPWPWVRLTAGRKSKVRGDDVWMGHPPTGTVRTRRSKDVDAV
jgi:hypothetical protein